MPELAQQCTAAPAAPPIPPGYPPIPPEFDPPAVLPILDPPVKPTRERGTLPCPS